MGLSHSPKIVTDGLVLCLDAANLKSYPGSGTTVNDISSYKTNATIYQATYADGHFILDGVDDNLYISNLSTNAPQIYSLTNTLSLEIIFNPNSVGGDDGSALIRCGLGTDLTFGLFYERTNRRFYFHWYDTTFQISYSSSNIITLDTWNIGTVVRNGSSVSFYINGNLINTNTGLTNTTPVPANLGIGATRAGTTIGTTGQDFAGKIACVKIYNKALSAAEVLQNFNALRGRFGI